MYVIRQLGWFSVKNKAIRLEYNEWPSRVRSNHRVENACEGVLRGNAVNTLPASAPLINPS